MIRMREAEFDAPLEDRLRKAFDILNSETNANEPPGDSSPTSEVRPRRLSISRMSWALEFDPMIRSLLGCEEGVGKDLREQYADHYHRTHDWEGFLRCDAAPNLPLSYSRLSDGRPFRFSSHLFRVQWACTPFHLCLV